MKLPCKGIYTPGLLQTLVLLPEDWSNWNVTLWMAWTCPLLLQGQ
jgi:hypothetical protein